MQISVLEREYDWSMMRREGDDWWTACYTSSGFICFRLCVDVSAELVTGTLTVKIFLNEAINN